MLRVPGQNAIFEIFLAISHFKNFKFTCCLVEGGISISKCPKFTKIFHFIFISHASQQRDFFNADMKKFMLKNSDKGVPETN